LPANPEEVFGQPQQEVLLVARLQFDVYENPAGQCPKQIHPAIAHARRFYVQSFHRGGARKSRQDATPWPGDYVFQRDIVFVHGP
jgi:hypothetical protein